MDIESLVAKLHKRVKHEQKKRDDLELYNDPPINRNFGGLGVNSHPKENHTNESIQKNKWSNGFLSRNRNEKDYKEELLSSNEKITSQEINSIGSNNEITENTQDLPTLSEEENTKKEAKTLDNKEQKNQKQEQVAVTNEQVEKTDLNNHSSKKDKEVLDKELKYLDKEIEKIDKELQTLYKNLETKAEKSTKTENYTGARPKPIVVHKMSVGANINRTDNQTLVLTKDENKQIIDTKEVLQDKHKDNIKNLKDEELSSKKQDFYKDNLSPSISKQEQLNYIFNQGIDDYVEEDLHMEKIEELLDSLANALRVFEEEKLIARSPKEIYDAHRLDTRSRENIFLIETYMKALPARMPLEEKTEVITEILSSFQIQKETLIQDGSERKRALLEEKQSIASAMQSACKRRQDVIDSLQELLSGVQESLQKVERYCKVQIQTIGDEMQRVDHNLLFFQDEDKNQKKELSNSKSNLKDAFFQDKLKIIQELDNARKERYFSFGREMKEERKLIKRGRRETEIATDALIKAEKKIEALESAISRQVNAIPRRRPVRRGLGSGISGLRVKSKNKKNDAES